MACKMLTGSAIGMDMPRKFCPHGSEQQMKNSWTAVAAAMLISATGGAQAYTIRMAEDLQKSASQQLTQLPNTSVAQSQFLSLLTGVRTENFESQTVGASGPLTLQFPSPSGSLSATLAGNGSVGSNPVGGTDGNGRFSVPGGTRFWLADAAADTFTVTFNKSIAAFGFYGIDIGDFGGSLILDLFDDGGRQVSSLPVGNTIGNSGSTDGSVLFYGLVANNSSELFRSIRFSMTGIDADFFAFDSFTIGDPSQVVGGPPNPAPEPGSLALVAVALLAAGIGRRWRG